MPLHPGYSIFNLITAPAILLKQEGKKLIVIEVNKAYEMLIGLQTESLIGADILNPVNLPVENRYFFEHKLVKSSLKKSLKNQTADKFILSTNSLPYEKIKVRSNAELIVENVPVCAPTDHTILWIHSIAINDVISLQQVDDSEKRFRNLVQDGSDMIAILDEKGSYKYVSPTSEAILGILPTYLIGKNAFDFIHPDDKDFVFDQFIKIEKNNRLALEPFRFASASNEWRWIETIITDLRSDPSINGIVANSRDITERIEAEKALLISNERYRYVTMATSDAIWDWDVVDNSLYWGEGFMTLFGYKEQPGFVEISSWISRLHPEDIERVETGIYSLIESGGTNWLDEYRYLKEDGSYAYVIDRGFVIRDINGKAIRMVGAMHDITQKKKEEQQLRLLESMVKHTKDAVMITDANQNHFGLKITYVNHSFTKMTGYSIEESLGQSPEFLSGKNTSKKTVRELRKSLNNFVANEVTMITYKKDGTEFWMNLATTPLSDENGVFTHWVIIQRDVTQQIKYYSAIEQQNERLKEISWMQSHVLRAPLTRLLGLTYILKNKIPQQKMSDLEITNEIENSAQELDSVIKKIVLRTDELEELG
ncbi:PAS domain S-box protein [Pedobacter aquatilis]|uniref:PAS domain-containing protein n=1 Tax=Pedobacter aquatilis TaxID=351343 RepID=UPI0029312C74|nr:PAS domain S-box protein [Pedobacter aquatilis]